MTRTIIAAGVCSIGAYFIGHHYGYSKCEKELRPQIRSLTVRIKFLEEGKVKK